MGYIGKIPSAVPLTSADITDNVITSAKIVDGTITNTDIASSIITGQTAETSIAGGDQILIYDDSATALRKMTRTNFVAGIGGDNTPAFFAIRSTSQTIPNATYTKMQFDSEKFDTNNAYDNSTNYRFTVPSGQGGKYLITVQAALAGLLGMMYLRLYVNGSAVNYSYGYMSGNTDNSISQTLIRDLSAGDYIEYFLYHDDGGNLSLDTVETNYFGAFKLIGV